jgi:hypothetical protein
VFNFVNFLMNNQNVVCTYWMWRLVSSHAYYNVWWNFRGKISRKNIGVWSLHFLSTSCSSEHETAVTYAGRQIAMRLGLTGRVITHCSEDIYSQSLYFTEGIAATRGHLASKFQIQRNWYKLFFMLLFIPKLA